MSTEYTPSGGAVGGGLNWLVDGSGDWLVDGQGQLLEAGPFTTYTISTTHVPSGGAVAAGTAGYTISTRQVATDLMIICYTVQAVRKQLIADNYDVTVARRY